MLRRAVAAGYHIGARATTGHYWAVVRGTEPPAPPPQAGAAPRQPPPAPQAPGFRRANDAEVADAMRTFARGVLTDMRWGGADAQRAVSLVALERVDGPRARSSLSERANLLAAPAPAPAGRPCLRCTLHNAPGARACVACRTPLRR